MFLSKPLYPETLVKYQVAQHTPPSNETLIWFYVTVQGNKPNLKVNFSDES